MADAVAPGEKAAARAGERAHAAPPGRYATTLPVPGREKISGL